MKNQKRHFLVSLFVFSMLINGCERQTDDKSVNLTAAGKPVEGALGSFLGEAKMDAQKLFEGNRFPNVVVGVDGSVLAFWGQQMRPHVRRSEDGGATWSTAFPIGDDPEYKGRGLGAGVVDETTGDIIIFMDGVSDDWFVGHSWRSQDNGKTWTHNGNQKEIIKPNSPVVINGRLSASERAFTHGNDNGITLRHGKHKGRLLIGARNWYPEEERQRDKYADTQSHMREHGTVWASMDGGKTWPVKRLVHKGPFAYSSLAVGRPETESEGWIYMQHEGGVEHHYEAGYMARFNLAWVLNGELTGDGKIPDWVN